MTDSVGVTVVSFRWRTGLGQSTLETEAGWRGPRATKRKQTSRKGSTDGSPLRNEHSSGLVLRALSHPASDGCFVYYLPITSTASDLGDREVSGCSPTGPHNWGSFRHPTIDPCLGAWCLGAWLEPYPMAFSSFCSFGAPDTGQHSWDLEVRAVVQYGGNIRRNVGPMSRLTAFSRSRGRLIVDVGRPEK
jgi:hypothetical protein